MRRKKSIARLMCIGALLLCSCTLASADAAQITPGKFLFLDEGNSVATAITLDGIAEYVWAGAYQISWAADPVVLGHPDLTDSQYAFCTDPTHNVTNGYRTAANVIAPLNDAIAGLPSAEYIFAGGAGKQAEADAVTYLSRKYLIPGVGPSALNAQVASLAIWDIVHDGGDGLTVGNFRSGARVADVAALIQEAFLPLNQASITQNQVRWVQTADDGKYAQDFAIVTPALSNLLVPEPAFIQMGALLGMSGLGFLKLRRRKA
ncbi:MAG: hypothetical protein WCL39_00330 [Armatimonadota bacterium]